MITPITEAHRSLVREMEAQGLYLRNSIEYYAQKIADSEARAVASAVAALTRTHRNDQQRSACPMCLVAALTAERDQLRYYARDREDLGAAMKEGAK